MARGIVDIEPTRVRHADPTAALRSRLRGMAEVRAPGEAEEPILAPAVRRAIRGWLAEIGAADELCDVGCRPSSTAVLHGPPGCGKTTLAHHMAARLGVPLVLVGAENIMASFLGESEGKVSRLFDALSGNDARCVLLMDEIESIGGDRSKNRGGGADNARNSILTVLLRKVEEFDGYLIGATNRPGDLDPALWRRFHLHIPIELPGFEERWAILRRYSLPFDLTDDDLDLIANATEGASPALLRGLMEGMKRALIVWPRIGRATDDPAALFEAIVKTVQPPPELDKPLLWEPRGAAPLSKLAWPPARVPNPDGGG